MLRKRLLWLTAALLCLPQAVLATHQKPNRLQVAIGVDLKLGDIIGNVLEFLVTAIIMLCTVLFAAGAFHFVFSHGQEKFVTRGKDLMIYSLVGLAVVLGAYGILRTVVYILYFT
ncbi:MAG: hypothetical protein Q7R81_06670 [Candidatus Peregrinibacteria bacterium]|nr:hypothetical protein [Candidatus Peregrinibacteria bacterium]